MDKVILDAQTGRTRGNVRAEKVAGRQNERLRWMVKNRNKQASSSSGPLAPVAEEASTDQLEGVPTPESIVRRRDQGFSSIHSYTLFEHYGSPFGSCFSERAQKVVDLTEAETSVPPAGVEWWHLEQIQDINISEV